MSDDAPSRALDKFMVRLPPGMREKIAVQAEKAGRSMNAEVVQRLADSLQPEAASAHIAELVTRANGVALTAGVLYGSLRTVAEMAEVRGAFNKSFIADLREDKAGFVENLTAFESAIDALRSPIGSSPQSAGKTARKRSRKKSAD